jgi:hypothetical protein
MTDDLDPSPLSYESRQDFKRRRRFFVLTPAHHEVIRLVLWMLGLLLAGVMLGILIHGVRWLQVPT